ncbi:MAG: hypothetical protein IT186_21150 [Acidobacteria bacterium]|nr:hypothetical protein [Acidobacteriota bacterium]MCG3193795.1 hypothetical protein [Thermoanaerobaculia bacterium]
MRRLKMDPDESQVSRVEACFPKPSGERRGTAPAHCRRYAMTLAALFGCLTVKSRALAQFDGAKIEIFASGKPSPKNFSDRIPEGAPLPDPVRLKPAAKPTDCNLFYRVTWTKPLAQDERAYAVVVDEKGRMVSAQGKPFVDKGARELTGCYTLKDGSYKLRLASRDDYEKSYVERPFAVGSGKAAGAATATGGIGTSRVWICDDTDDDLKPLKFSGDPEKGLMSWPSGKDFNILVKNSKSFNVNQIKIVIHHQNADGSDGKFVFETRSDTLRDTSTMWASTGGITPGSRGLEPGAYTVYVIDDHQGEVYEHKGGFSEYFSRIKLTVK